MVQQTRKLNLIPTEDIMVISVSHNDTGEGRFIFDLYAGDDAYSPSGSAVIQGTKANGKTFTHAVTINGSRVTADLLSDMSDVPGQVKAQIVITEGDNRTGSQIFFLSVQEAV